jgi:hypothetical protein
MVVASPPSSEVVTQRHLIGGSPLNATNVTP